MGWLTHAWCHAWSLFKIYKLPLLLRFGRVINFELNIYWWKVSILRKGTKTEHSLICGTKKTCSVQILTIPRQSGVVNQQYRINWLWREKDWKNGYKCNDILQMMRFEYWWINHSLKTLIETILSLVKMMSTFNIRMVVKFWSLE